jgi:WD40 repeat protein/tRNA A-37 threonylcarbamoyl transferase component Bud32
MSGPPAAFRATLPAPPGYEIVGKIAEGGQGAVYKARQKMPSRMVALKVLLQGALASEEEKSRFLREANAAAALKHPGIVPIYEVGEHEGKYFFSMEYVEGQPLHQYLSQTPLSLKEKLLLFLKICDAVTHAHIRGVIHRDLKPQNIMVDKDGSPRVLDFGLAKLAEMGTGERRSFVTQSSVFMGTPAYMSPEQTLGKQELVDTRSDVYSLGVILYEMLTGAMPYPVDSQDVFDVIKSIREREPQRPSSLARALRGDLETILLKVVSKEKEHRYQSCADLARDVRHLLANEPIEARPSSVWYRISKTVQRHKAASLVTALVTVAFLVAFVWITYLRSVAEEARTHAEQERDRAEKAAIAEADQRKRAEEARNAEAQQRKVAEQERDRAERAAKAEAEQRRLAQEARDKAVQKDYITRIALAEKLTQEQSFDQAEAILESCPSELRNWEWGRLKFLCQIPAMTIRGNLGAVTCLAFSPDNKWIASGASDKTVRIWNAEDGSQLKSLTGHSGTVRYLSFSPDGKQIASASFDRTVRIWDWQTGREILSLDLSRAWWLPQSSTDPRSVAFSPDGKRLAVGCSGAISIWDIETSEQRTSLTFQSGPLTSLAFSPDGKHIASCHAGLQFLQPGALKIWDVKSGKELVAKNPTLFRAPRYMAFMPDGKLIADGFLGPTVMDVRTGEELPGRMFGDLSGEAISPDGSLIAGKELFAVRKQDSTIDVEGALTGRPKLNLRGHSGPRYSLCISPGGKCVAAGGRDTLFVWHLDLNRSPKTIRTKYNFLASVAISPNGRLIACSSVGGKGNKADALMDPVSELEVFDLNTSLKLETINPAGVIFPLSLKFGPDSRKIACCVSDPHWKSGTVKVWNAESGQELMTLKGHVKLVTSVAFSPDGSLIASASADKSVKIWDMHTQRELMAIRGDFGEVSSVAFSPDGKRIAAGSDRLVVFDVMSGRELANMNPKEKVASVAFSQDGTHIGCVSAVQSKEKLNIRVSVYDAASGEQVRTLDMRSPGFAAFSPDWKRIASGSIQGGGVTIWDALSGQEVMRVSTPWHNTMSVAFSPDGKRLAAGGLDGGTITIWEAAEWRQ